MLQYRRYKINNNVMNMPQISNDDVLKFYLQTRAKQLMCRVMKNLSKQI